MVLMEFLVLEMLILAINLDRREHVFFYKVIELCYSVQCTEGLWMQYTSYFNIFLSSLFLQKLRS